MEQNKVSVPGLEIEIAVLKHHLDQGWSIYYSLNKAKITQAMHTRLLKIPEYAALLAKYRRCYRKRGHG